MAADTLALSPRDNSAIDDSKEVLDLSRRGSPDICYSPGHIASPAVAAVPSGQPLDFSSKAFEAAFAAAAAASAAAVSSAGNSIPPSPPMTTAVPPPPPTINPMGPSPIFNMNALSKMTEAATTNPPPAATDPVENMQRLQRLIKANQALAISKMQQAAVAAKTLTTTGVSPAAPPVLPLAASVAAAAAATETHGPTELQRVNQESLQQYNHFRENMLRQFTLAKMKRRRRSDSPGGGNAMNTSEDGSTAAISSPPSPSSSLENSSPENNNSQQQQASRKRRGEQKDEAYWERRRKNNEAAKRSRDARRAKEDEIAIRAAFLEQENIQLKWEVASLKSETCRLKTLLLNDAAASATAVGTPVLDNAKRP